MEERLSSFNHLNRWVCQCTQRQLPKYICGCLAKARIHGFPLELSSVRLDGGEKNQCRWHQKFHSYNTVPNNTLRVNTNFFLHCSTFQCTIQSPFLAWKAILLKVCLVTFQTNDLTRTSQDKCWVNKGQSAARFSARIPSKGIQLYSGYHLSGITYPFSLRKWVIAGTRARM